ncbi:hypothetical protein SAMN06265371_103446 [Lutibacter agarilyticus]|uniref:Cellobiose phosphorylase n=1 Tax=Lutibacter agarilyticus TaxID=1109740 RepID=A0A238WQ01_9FLAO|nr:hypothetical protein [Lutibacter agarilyticus]SNR48461.1 hypothetical protein SAMN06265371_103446 [Lutibacter agarilyticus]
MYIGDKEASFGENEVTGKLVSIGDESYYKISNVNEMRPFFMSVVSHSNHWMFISSNGGLSAGRKNSNYALFPYYTDDKITESAEITGSKTLLQVHINKKTYLWEPFSNKYTGVYNISRNLYKNNFGNKLIFEEINHDLGVTYKYQWNSSDRFGFVKIATLINNTDKPVKYSVLDGIQNIIPHGISSDFQNSSSNLVDAYKKCELEAEVGLGIFALSAIIVDKAEPSEALKANIVWSAGIENPTYLLSSKQLENFRKGKQLQQEVDIKAEKGAYFTCAEITLEANAEKEWILAADVNKSIVHITEITETIKNEKDLIAVVKNDIEEGTQQLIELTGNADGLQLTADKLQNTRHFSNTLFNIMRGGIFDDNYNIEKEDFAKYIANANKKVWKKKEDLIQQLPTVFSLNFLKKLASEDDDKNFKRLCFEYMPLKFSRRHGDPSRPWNKFSINTRSEIDGSKILDYEGNWRDIFQNWEALAHSYPQFIESMIFKFLNATTFEGYNPYRVTKGGFDWETIEPDDPWSYIGYWGDHQIIYLLKFLEFIEDYYPTKLSAYFNQEMFVYANVPYKIKSYSDTLKNPKDTIDFDIELDHQINQKKKELGADGALLRDENFFIHKVNFIEKIMATVLAKVSNFIPEGGIWLNTQRPEWNDANNALVGNGVSMVTLYYLRRFLKFFEALIQNNAMEEVLVSEEIKLFFDAVVKTFEGNEHLLSGKISDEERKTILDGLGNAGSEYRAAIYSNGFTGEKTVVKKSELQHFCDLTTNFLEHTIRANKRTDDLYHSYNLMTVENDKEISISYLSEMLEGQVAVLSSGYLSSTESLALLDGLKNSALYREDQYSYILYPNKNLSRFVDKNNISAKKVEKLALIKQLLKDGNKQIVEKDILGNFHFNGNFNNADSLKNALAELPEEQYKSLVEEDEKALLNIFEEIFDHKSFTGRSGTFFGYEGLGSIYWHMVSKLVVAVQENCLKAIEANESAEVVGRLLEHYYEINEGIGVHKSPELYGAIPTDPYSHTPGGKGAQQPGMTGQVKEDVLSRFKELGVQVKNGELQFKPTLLRKDEFLKTPKKFKYTTIDKQVKEIELDKDSLCFTYCQIPVVYKLGTENAIQLIHKNGNKLKIKGQVIDGITSEQIFSRSGEIERIEVVLK